MPDPLFRFMLRPVEDIAPWGSREAPILHWFALTDGSFSIDVGDDVLFRARNEQGDVLDVDYEVARLWEDVLDWLPAVLSPVPPDFAARFDPRVYGIKGARRSRQHDEENDVSWFFERMLACRYLAAGPRIWAWSTATEIHIAWDQREHAASSSRRTWTASVGAIAMARARFLAEVESFDARLMRAMAERVAAVLNGESRPRGLVDRARLEVEQRDRSGWLGRALCKVRASDDWDGARRRLLPFL